MPRKTFSKGTTAALQAETSPTVTAGRGKHSSFCAYVRDCGFDPRNVRGKLRKSGLHGPYVLGDPQVMAIVEKLVAARTEA